MSGGICLFTLNSSSVNNTHIAVGKPASSYLLKKYCIKFGVLILLCVCVWELLLFLGVGVGRDFFFGAGGGK